MSLVWEKYYDNGRLPEEVKNGSFWWRDVLKLLDKYKGMARAEVNSGKSYYLWEDLWENEPLSGKFPELFSFAKKKKKPPLRKEGLRFQSIAYSTYHYPSKHMHR